MFKRNTFLFSWIKTEIFNIFFFWGGGGSGVLYKVWNLYEKGRLCEAAGAVSEDYFWDVDPSWLLQIGLLCVQAAAELRPSMSVVVKMLINKDEIPQPTPPPCVNYWALEKGPICLTQHDRRSLIEPSWTFYFKDNLTLCSFIGTTCHQVLLLPTPNSWLSRISFCCVSFLN